MDRMKNEKPKIQQIEKDMPSAKTASISQFDRYARFLLLHMSTLHQYYDRRRIGRQQASDEFAERLISGGSKYPTKDTRNQRRHRKQKKRRQK
ncbi:hypothetical protein EC973_007602 [Apophysomyces ossiformis]|uniref:Uncharacterized protein n=1 Tax=Apophysomyces ossiformis TaxID=679940 RepID=A0A8H7BUF4_9FUNG|nr:hypothetical protein EC973_007602 [Apophysomyces ossiformis]